MEVIQKQKGLPWKKIIINIARMIIGVAILMVGMGTFFSKSPVAWGAIATVIAFSIPALLVCEILHHKKVIPSFNNIARIIAATVIFECAFLGVLLAFPQALNLPVEGIIAIVVLFPIVPMVIQIIADKMKVKK